jgi:hypothetical protein
MIRFRRLMILPLAAVAAAAAAAVLWELRGPAWVMPVVASEIEAATHLRLETGAALEPRLLPSPGFRVPQVRLSPVEDGGAPLLTAETLEVTLSWSGLLRLKARPETLHLTGTRVLAAALSPPLDVVVRPGGSTEILLSSPVGRGRVVAHVDGGSLALDDVVVQTGRWTAAGSGRLLPHDPLRLVLNTQLGFGDARLGSLAAAISYSADGVVLERAEWRQTNGSDVELFGHAAIEGDSLRFEGGLAASIGNPAAVDASARFDGATGPGGTTVSLDDVDMRADGSHLTGRAKYTGGAAAQLSAELRIDRLDVAALTALMQARSGPLAGFFVDTVAAAEVELRLRLGELVLNGTTAADGVVLDAARQGGAIELRELAARAVAGAPLRATGRLAIGPAPVVAADPLELSYGAVTAKGRGQLDFAAARPRLTLDVATGPLALDTLLAGPPALPPEPMTRRAAAASMAAARQAPATPAWSREPMRLPQNLPIDAEVTLASPQLSWRSYRLGDAKAFVQLTAQQLLLKQLSGTLYGGRLDASAAVEPRVPPHVGLQARLSGADLAATLGVLADIRNVAGHGDLVADLQADGASMAELVASLAGKVEIAGRDGTISGIDIDAVAEQLKRSARPTDLIAIGRLAMGGQTRFSTLAGRFQIERGIARTDSLILTAAHAAAQTRGAIDLPNWSLNLVNEFQLSEPPGVPPLVIRLEGPVASPRRVFDISRLQAYLLHRGAAAPGR